MYTLVMVYTGTLPGVELVGNYETLDEAHEAMVEDMRAEVLELDDDEVRTDVRDSVGYLWLGDDSCEHSWAILSEDNPYEEI